MNSFITTLRLIIVVFAMATAGLLIFRVFGGISTEELKDSILKIALVCGIITALSAVVMTLTVSKNK